MRSSSDRRQCWGGQGSGERHKGRAARDHDWSLVSNKDIMDSSRFRRDRSYASLPAVARKTP